MARDARCFRPPSLDKIIFRLPGQGRRMIALSLSCATGSCSDQSIYRSCIAPAGGKGPERGAAPPLQRTWQVDRPLSFHFPFPFSSSISFFFSNKSSTLSAKNRNTKFATSALAGSRTELAYSRVRVACHERVCSHWCLPVRHLTHALSLISACFMI